MAIMNLRPTEEFDNHIAVQIKYYVIVFRFLDRLSQSRGPSHSVKFGSTGLRGFCKIMINLPKTQKYL